MQIPSDFFCLMFAEINRALIISHHTFEKREKIGRGKLWRGKENTTIVSSSQFYFSFS